MNAALEKVGENASPDAAIHNQSMSDILGDGSEVETPKSTLPEGGPPPPPIQGKPLNYPKLKSLNPNSTVKKDLPPLPIAKKPPLVEKQATIELSSIENIPQPPMADDDPGEYYNHIMELFKALKLKLNENIDDFDEVQFLVKLAKSTDGIRAKSNCKQVDLQVYDRDGKAGLKAVPRKS